MNKEQKKHIIHNYVPYFFHREGDYITTEQVRCTGCGHILDFADFDEEESMQDWEKEEIERMKLYPKQIHLEKKKKMYPIYKTDQTVEGKIFMAFDRGATYRLHMSELINGKRRRRDHIEIKVPEDSSNPDKPGGDRAYDIKRTHGLKLYIWCDTPGQKVYYNDNLWVVEDQKTD